MRQSQPEERIENVLRAYNKANLVKIITQGLHTLRYNRKNLLSDRGNFAIEAILDASIY